MTRGSFKDWLEHLIALICIPIGWIVYLLLVIFDKIRR